MKKLFVLLIIIFSVFSLFFIPQSVKAQDKSVTMYKDFGGVGGNRSLTFYENGTIIFGKLVISPQVVTTLPIKLTNDTWGVKYELTSQRFTLNIYFDFRFDKRIKITLNGTSTILTQLPLKIVSSTATVLSADSTKVSIGDTEFNWEDSPSGIWSSITSTISFTIFAGKFTIDPYLVIVTTSSTSTQYPHQRKTFEAVTRWWAWFTTNTTTTSYLSFSSSANSGVTWATPTQLRTATSGRMFSVATNGSHVAYVYCPETYGGDPAFRLGALNSDGTITWAAAEQSIYDLININGVAKERAYNPSICFDSDDLVWVTFAYSDTVAPAYSGMMAGNTKTDGTWTNRASTPGNYITGMDDTTFRPSSIEPLASNKVICIFMVYNQTFDRLWGRVWNSGSWNAIEIVDNCTAGSSSTYPYFSSKFGISTCSYSGNVKVTYAQKDHLSSPTISMGVYSERDSTGTWSRYELYNGLNTTTIPVLSLKNDNSTAYVFWGGLGDKDFNKYISHMYWDGTTWDVPWRIDWIDTGDTFAPDFSTLSVFKEYTTNIGILYTNGTNPYFVKYEVLTLGAAVTNYIIDLTASITNTFSNGIKTTFKIVNTITPSVAFLLRLNIAFQLTFSMASSQTFLNYLSSGYSLTMEIASTTAFSLAIMVAYQISTGFTTSISFILQMASTFAVVMLLASQSIFSLFLNTTYSISTELTSSVSFLLDILYARAGLKYFVDLVFASSSTFNIFINTSFNVNSVLSASVAFDNFLNTAFNISTNMTSTVSMILIASYGTFVNLIITPTVSFTLDLFTGVIQGKWLMFLVFGLLLLCVFGLPLFVIYKRRNNFMS
jgi:hypothetical protein